MEGDIQKSIKVFKQQFNNFKNLKRMGGIPGQCEVLVIGGGLVGSFVAYWVKTLSPSLNVVVVEKDCKYLKSSTHQSVGGIRQQFSLPENIEMSMFGAEFVRNAQENLAIKENEPIDLQFHQDGYLFLANQASSKLLFANHKEQLNRQAKVRLLNKEQLKSTFKWINEEDIELGSFGYMNEGWVDPRKFLIAVRNKAISLGAHFVDGELLKFTNTTDEASMIIHNSSIQPINTGVIRPISDDKQASGEQPEVSVRFRFCVNAAGPWAADVARLAGIGSGQDDEDRQLSPLASSLPVEPRKRYIFMFYAENGPLLNVPLTIDYSGVFFRRQGLSNYYLCGLNQSAANEPTDMDLNHIDYDYFEQAIKPVLMRRVPGFHNMKLVNAWSGYYEYNTLDQNLIIGPHPTRTNLLFANGSSGHGLQHAPAIGRAITELILHQQFMTIDLSRFGFERVLANEPIKEIDVV